MSTILNMGRGAICSLFFFHDTHALVVEEYGQKLGDLSLQSVSEKKLEGYHAYGDERKQKGHLLLKRWKYTVGKEAAYGYDTHHSNARQ